MTSSVAIAGVLLVFCYLVVPSVGAMLFADSMDGVWQSAGPWEHWCQPWVFIFLFCSTCPQVRRSLHIRGGTDRDVLHPPDVFPGTPDPVAQRCNVHRTPAGEDVILERSIGSRKNVSYYGEGHIKLTCR